ncbi:MAG: ATP-grasp domain-containing protein [Actinomycetota bacterium]|nr:ATP-grasp domain-containing protein [Actinomycetota bacterium]
MKIHFLVVRRVPPVPSPVLLEVYDILRRRDYEVGESIAEESVVSPDRIAATHDLYVVKSHTELSLSLAGVLDTQGAMLLNPYRSCITTQDKIVASRRLRAASVPIPRGWITGDLRLLREVLEGSPLIVKPHRGHRGAGIRVIHHAWELEDDPLPEGAVIAQEYLGEPGEDLKVYVIGKQVLGVRKPFSSDSFTRAGQPCAVDESVVQIARRCGEVLGLGLYGLDIIQTNIGPKVVDVNYFPGYKGVPDAAELIADYIDEYARGRATLELPSLRIADEVGIDEVGGDEVVRAEGSNAYVALS